MNPKRLILLQICMIASLQFVTAALIIIVSRNHTQSDALDRVAEASIELAEILESLRTSKDESVTFPKKFRTLCMHSTTSG